MNANWLKNKWNYLWLGLAMIASGLLSYGIFTNLAISLSALLILIVLLLVLNNFEIGIFLILLSIIVGQLLKVGLAEYGGSIITSDLLVILVGGIWLARVLIKRQRIKNTPIDLLLLLFAVIAVISLLFSLNLVLPRETFKASFYLVRFISYAIIFYIALDYVKSVIEARKYFYWILAITIGLAILGFIQLIYVPDFAFMSRFGWDPHQGRLLSTFFDPNFVGGFFGFVISLILGVWFLSADKNQKIWLAIIGFIIFIALILTFSRSAYLGFLVSFVLVSLIRSWKITIVGLIIISLFLISFPRAISRIKSAWSLDETASSRIESWQQGWEIISDHPIVGVGYNTLPYVKPTYYFSQQDKLTRSAGGIDSSILTIWATTGIFGLLIYLGMYAMIIWQSFKAYLDKNHPRFIRGFGLGLAVAMIGLLINAQFINSLLYSPMMILIWLCGGILFGLTYKTVWPNFGGQDLMEKFKD